jgi:hypothetical protein
MLDASWVNQAETDFTAMEPMSRMRTLWPEFSPVPLVTGSLLARPYGGLDHGNAPLLPAAIQSR